MIPISIAFHENDRSVGDYFFSSAQDMQKHITEDAGQNFELTDFSPLSGETSLLQEISHPGKPFLFAIYCHGEPEALHGPRGPVLAKNKIEGEFSGSVFYTNACHAAKEIGPRLIEKGCRVFGGYAEEVNIPISHENIFIQCQNHALRQFMAGLSLRESLASALDFYDEKSDDMYEKNPVAAMLMEKNRDSFRMLGDPEATIHDLKSEENGP